MQKVKIMAIKGNNWFEQFSTIGNLIYPFVGKIVKITVEESDESGNVNRMG